MEEWLVFLLVAVLVGLLTFIIVPRVPTAVLMLTSAVGLAVGVWWHWQQFSADYRTSTWQQSLRQYASYVVLLLVILVSYGIYALFVSDSPIAESVSSYVSDATETVRNITERASNTVSNTVSNITEPVANNSIISSLKNSFFNNLNKEIIPTPANMNRGANNANKRGNILF